MSYNKLHPGALFPHILSCQTQAGRWPALGCITACACTHSLAHSASAAAGRAHGIFVLNGVIGSLSAATSAAMRASLIMKLVAQVSSSISSTHAPSSRHSCSKHTCCSHQPGLVDNLMHYPTSPTLSNSTAVIDAAAAAALRTRNLMHGAHVTDEPAQKWMLLRGYESLAG